MNDFLEILEDRIAPASVTFTDVDGDIVTVNTNKGAQQHLQDAVTAAVDNMGQMKTLNLDSAFAGANLKIAVTSKAAAGDGQANVWAINAAGIDLGSVEVKGDLAKLVVGDANYNNGSVKTITVQSIGVNGGALSKDWHLLGSTNSLVVAGDVKGAKLFWENPNSGGAITVGSLSIGGSLIGGSADNTGLIKVRGGDDSAGKLGLAKIDSLFIGQNLVGTAYSQTGAVIVGDEIMLDEYHGAIGKISVGGSLKGVVGKLYTGAIFTSSGSIGDVQIGGDLTGGGFVSGSVFSYQGTLGNVKVNGSVEGSSGLYSGSIYAGFAIKSVSVGGSMSGGSGANSGSIISGFAKIGNVSIGSYLAGGSGVSSGSINGETGLGKVTVGGSVFGGFATDAGSIFTASNGANRIGDVLIHGSVFGGSALNAGSISGDYLGKVRIDGSLDGGTATGSGSIFASKNVTSIFIGQDLKGGAMDGYSGAIRIYGTDAKVAAITVGHDVIGAGGAYSGSISVGGSVGKLSVGSDVKGGAGDSSGRIAITGKVGNLMIGGDVLGSNGFYSAKVSVEGNTGVFSIGGDVVGGSNGMSGHIDLHNIGTGFVGGSLMGGSGGYSGRLEFENGNAVTIGGGLLGGSGDYSGGLSFITLNKLTIGTVGVNGVSLYGGSGGTSGSITADGVKTAWIAGDIIGGSLGDAGAAKLGAIGTVIVGGNVVGGSGNTTGMLKATSVSGKLTIGGDVVGGVGNSFSSGMIFINGNAKSIELKGNLIGGTTTASGASDEGGIFVDGTVGSLTIGGSIKGGTAFDASNQNLGSVHAKVIGTMLVKGDITGNASNYVTLAAKGDTAKSKGANVAIKSLTIQGSVSYANILGGYDIFGSTLNGEGGVNGGSAQLGAITVLGDFLNSSIATGVSNDNAAKNHWADGTNTLLSKTVESNIVASIAKIVIRGAVSSIVQNGIVAEQIKSLNIGGSNVLVPLGVQHFKAAPGSFWIQQIG